MKQQRENETWARKVRGGSPGKGKLKKEKKGNKRD